MKNVIHLASLVAALVMGWSLERVQDPETTEATEPAGVEVEVEAGVAYLELYHAGKIEEMRPFLTETSVFEDRTAEAMGSTFRLTGGDRIVTELTQIVAAQDPEYTGVFAFQSGRFAVSAGAFAYEIPGQGEEETVRVELQVATIVEFDGDHVVRHSDHANYPGMMKSLKEQRERDK